MNIGGPSLHVYYLTEGLRKDRFESHLVVGKVSHLEGSMEDLFSGPWRPLTTIPELRREINVRRDLIAFFKLLRIIRSKKPHIVHTHMSKAGYLARLAVVFLRVFGRRRILAVHTFHGNVFSGYFSPWKSKLFLLIERMLARFTDAIIAISEGQRRDLVHRFRVAGPDKIRMIRLGFDLEPFLSNDALKGRFRERLGMGVDQRLVGIVGRLVPVKNHRLFLEAVRQLKEADPGDQTRFVVVGDGMLRGELENLVRDLEVADRVIFSGWQREMASVYADLDLLCLTSINEGTPVAVIEAMASGVPVAATDVGGGPDLLGPVVGSSGEALYAVCERGLMCRRGDPESVAWAIRDVILGAVPELDRCVMRARLYVAQYYSRGRLVEDVENLYESLLEGCGRAGKAKRDRLKRVLTGLECDRGVGGIIRCLINGWA
ncbi:MAG: glycosyltransferase [Deltaproteobacteria bacterium]|nr:glycosyltransferase [Deltaproteobacteria bacterium]MBW2008075.1 glycosyltransferase [Deltaproteobacteria bacterium]MBW2104038.1 glycosyltransferase [Deltaproteobacteria bacterium]MBW2349446.1 glycosyltransferase [Deltaproteobacteria bacterium]